MAGRPLDSHQRLSLLVEIQREILAAGDDLERVMQLVVERSHGITGADGAMVNLVEGDMLRTRAATGIAARPLAEFRPIASSVGRFAIESGQPLLVADARTDPRINQLSRARIGQESLICVPLMHGAHAVGTLNVMSGRREHPLTEDDRETLEVLSTVLSAAVSRAAELEALARLQTLMDGASIGILRLDFRGRIIEANPALAQLLGADARQLIGRRLADHVQADQRAELESRLAHLATGEATAFEMEVCCTQARGGLVWSRVRAVREPTGGPTGASVVAMLEDVTDRRRAEEELVRQAALNEHQAMHDPLTGLPNRALFGERIGQAVRSARRAGGRLAILLMDLDRFKEVNDSLGHPAGDALLVQVGRRISAALRESDTFARLGGDEFGLLVPDVASDADLARVLDRIREALEQPVEVGGIPLAVDASIGVATFPEHGDSVQTLLQRADVAMYQAKRDSTTVCVYDDRTHRVDITRLTLVAELRRAIDSGELVLHYQPKARLEDGEVSSVEALLRWQHPARGLVFPDAFIPVAQETSLIGPLTLCALELALGQVGAWQDAGLDLVVAVNLSTRNLLDRDFPSQVVELLHRCGVAPAALALEVTESAMLANPRRARAVLEDLAQLGIRLSIDDFGTGYSSLSYLRELPVDEIKIDRSFVMGMCERPQDLAIVRSTIDLGRNLGLDVVAEGVESAAIWERLRELGCPVGQGYYLSRPAPADALEPWLRERAAVARS